MQMPYKTSLFITTTKTPFLSSLLISLHHKSVKGVSYTRINIFINRDCLTDIPTKVTVIRKRSWTRLGHQRPAFTPIKTIHPL
jgi:hypothetical protein